LTHSSGDWKVWEHVMGINLATDENFILLQLIIENVKASGYTWKRQNIGAILLYNNLSSL
jgi:hypothetical protein